MISVALMTLLLLAEAPSAHPNSPAAPSPQGDAGVAADSTEDAEVMKNLDLLENMPTVENLDLIQALGDEPSHAP